MYNKFSKTKKFLAVLIILTTVSTFTLTAVTTANAQVLTVPINTLLDFNTTMQYMKSFALDKIASMIAKQILHMMMQSVVTWINSGFKGSPAFIQNPAGFFTKAADDLAAQFISTGPLRLLCSPFALNIQLNLASGQANNDNNNYTCTIDKIIQNVHNGVSGGITVNGTANGATINDIINGNILNQPGQLSVNGNSVNGLVSAASSSANAIANAPSGLDAFMAGDFSQGGWPAFMAMLSEPQNNPYSAYLMAQSDLIQKQDAQTKSTNSDLDRSGGFLSWEDCQTEVTVAANSPSQDEELTAADSRFQGDSSIKTKVTANGDIQYQKCSTQTPGSVISSTLTKSLGGGQDELVAANDINAIINASMAQLMSMVLQNGLGSFSSGGSQSSYLSNANAAARASNTTAKTLQTAETNLQTNINDYKQSIMMLNNATSSIANVQSCLATARTNPNLSQFQLNQISNASGVLTNIVNRKINPLMTNLQAAYATNTQALANFTDFTATSTSNISTTTSVESITGSLQDMVKTSYVTSAANDLKTTTTLTNSVQTDINRFQTLCDQLQAVTSSSTTP